MKKYVLTAAVLLVLGVRNGVFGETGEIGKAFKVARKEARCYTESSEDIGYACPLCKEARLFVLCKPGHKFAGENIAVLSRKQFGFIPCEALDGTEMRRYKPECCFVCSEYFHIELVHQRCAICFESIEKLSTQEIREHYWTKHNVCKGCGYSVVTDKKKHLNWKRQVVGSWIDNAEAGFKNYRCYRDIEGREDIGYACPKCSGSRLFVLCKHDEYEKFGKINTAVFSRYLIKSLARQKSVHMEEYDSNREEHDPNRGKHDPNRGKREPNRGKHEPDKEEYEPDMVEYALKDCFWASEIVHMECYHRYCGFCFDNFSWLSDKEIKVHLWEKHSVCKECGYENVANKEKHLKEKHNCNCSKTDLVFRHAEDCSSRWLWCGECKGLCRIGHFREKHRCNEKCEIRYNFGTKKFEISHGCHVKCPECLRDVLAVHMDETEKCSAGCGSNGGKWEHARGCRHWVQCKLCTNEVVCATPLHMQETHGCGLEETECCKEGKVWRHGEHCPVLWYSEYESNRAFGDGAEFLKYAKGFECSCKIINPSRGHEEGCPCRKRCPFSDECVVFGSIESHVKAAHKDYGFCPGCKEWRLRNSVGHMELWHKCKCKKSLAEVHDKGCPCFLRCLFCGNKPVSWEHMGEIHGCGFGCGVFRPVVVEKWVNKCFCGKRAEYSDWRCFEGYVDKGEAKNNIPPCKNYLRCPICKMESALSVSHMQLRHHCTANCGMREISDGKQIWMHAGCPNHKK